MCGRAGPRGEPGGPGPQGQGRHRGRDRGLRQGTQRAPGLHVKCFRQATQIASSRFNRNMRTFFSFVPRPGICPITKKDVSREVHRTRSFDIDCEDATVYFHFCSFIRPALVIHPKRTSHPSREQPGPFGLVLRNIGQCPVFEGGSFQYTFALVAFPVVKS